MLNRRSLRVKVMQSLYALDRYKEAYELIARDQAGAHFDFNLNSEEEQNREELIVQKKAALKAFDESFVTRSISDQCPDVVREQVEDAISLYYNEVETKEKTGLKDLIGEADKVSTMYLRLLQLPVVWKEMVVKEWNKIIGNNKKVPSGYENLTSNTLIKAIEDHNLINDLTRKHKIGWDSSVAGEWFRKILMKDEEYLAYSSKSSPTIVDHISIINNIYKRIFFKHEIINDYMEDQDIEWSENRGILKSMVIKTIKSFDDSDASIQMINLSPNWDEDREFYIRLYKQTINDNSNLEKVIASKSKNWDVERIAAVDFVILKLALSELIHFPSIPVKVTINEYIEICKSYSTPKSKQYVNGILDVLSSELMKDGTIKKSGRGLLDNK
ncbi:MAG: transcription antitermination factor NusB [Bacteroidetes bacterium]|nr:transcription antitermination factor NusB [Bacteroidota bacterium]MDA1118957.1 transcription antitermination factor NusB [Bacteroidota bacterium]